MSEWRETRIGDVCKIIHGFAFKGEYFSKIPSPYYLVTPGNFCIGGGFKIEKPKYYTGEFPSNYILNTGDLIVTMTDLSQAGDTLGYSALVPKHAKHKYLHNQRIGKVLVDEKEIDRNFLYWLMRSSNYQDFIVGAASGSAVRHTSPTTISEYKFQCPSCIIEQKSIAEVLSSLDDKIDLLSRQNKTLENLAATYFRQWFIEEANNEWKKKGLDEIAIFLNGLALQKYPCKQGEPLLVIKIKELNDGFSDNSDICSADIPEKYIVNLGDVVFSWSGSLVVDIWKYGRGALNQHLFKVTSDEYPKWFYYYWIQEHLKEFKIIAESKATTMGHIQRGHLTAAKVLVPSKPEIEEMNKIMDPLIKKIEQNNLQLGTLKKLRDTLLPKLISGEVRVRV